MLADSAHLHTNLEYASLEVYLQQTPDNSDTSIIYKNLIFKHSGDFFFMRKIQFHNTAQVKGCFFIHMFL